MYLRAEPCQREDTLAPRPAAFCGYYEIRNGFVHEQSGVMACEHRFEQPSKAEVEVISSSLLKGTNKMISNYFD
jgi:hypothetical protein